MQDISDRVEQIRIEITSPLMTRLLLGFSGTDQWTPVDLVGVPEGVLGPDADDEVEDDEDGDDDGDHHDGNEDNGEGRVVALSRRGQSDAPGFDPGRGPYQFGALVVACLSSRRQAEFCWFDRTGEVRLSFPVEDAVLSVSDDADRDREFLLTDSDQAIARRWRLRDHIARWIDTLDTRERLPLMGPYPSLTSPNYLGPWDREVVVLGEVARLARRGHRVHLCEHVDDYISVYQWLDHPDRRLAASERPPRPEEVWFVDYGECCSECVAELDELGDAGECFPPLPHVGGPSENADPAMFGTPA